MRDEKENETFFFISEVSDTANRYLLSVKKIGIVNT